MYRGAIGVVAGCLAFDAAAGGGRVVFYSDFEAECTAEDEDADRLTDCAEKGLKLDSTQRDTDGDGLFDGDEVLGTLSGLDLPAFGVDPRRKNILLEYDWFVDANETGGPNNCAAGVHTHRPTAASLAIVTEAFVDAPVGNPDGSIGIDVIHDVGQGGVFSGGTQVPEADGIVEGSSVGPEFFQYYSADFALNRRGYFHYVLLPHRFFYDGEYGYSGSALVDDGFRRDRMMVSLHCNVTDKRIAHTVMHELGHNLGLRHGGDTDCNRKPNYNSIMNYRFQFGGIDSGCDAWGDGVPDYSIGVRAPLDEQAIDERAGVCGDVAIDWTVQNGIEPLVVANLNKYLEEVQQCGGEITVLADHDDWGALEIGVDATNTSGSGEPGKEAATCSGD